MLNALNMAIVSALLIVSSLNGFGAEDTNP